MPKTVKQPVSSSTDHSDASYKVKDDSKCKKESESNDCECYSPEQLLCLYKNAVVAVQSEFILIGASGPTAGVTGGTFPEPNVRIDLSQSASGFFIKGHYIITTASAVLLPPSLTSVVNRYPYFNPIDLNDPDRRIQNSIVRASRILVTVYNVNNDGHSFVYEADLVGVDGAGNIAVLRINYRKPWNFCNPIVDKCHPILKFGKSREAKDGEKIYLIGDYVSDLISRNITNGAGLISDGLLSDHRYVDYTGFIFPEIVLVSAPAYTFSTGLPIINCHGKVIAMQAADVAAVNDAFTSVVEGQGWVGGISEFFMRRVIKTIIRGACSRKPNCQLEVVCDPVGSYYRYKKGYLGMSYGLLTGLQYDTVADYTSGIPLEFFSRFRLSDNGEFLNSPSCKEIIGIVVDGLAGLNPEDANGVPNGVIFIAGGTGPAPLALGLPLSPLLGKIQPGDIITHINNVPLGDLGKQNAPSLITWRLCAGDQLDITYRRGGNVLNGQSIESSGNYDNLFTITVCVADFPALYDYPWYAIDRFPLLADFGFIFPANQRTGVQFPTLDTSISGTGFKPAL